MTAPNIYQRLLAVQKDVSYIQKEDKRVNGQYRYVSHDAVAKRTRGPLIEHGVLFVPSFNFVEINGNMTIIECVGRFVNADNPAEEVTVKTMGYGIDPQDKGAGKAMSYGVKYALLKGLNLETGEDPEQDDIDHAPQYSPPQRQQPRKPQSKPEPTPEPVPVSEPDVRTRLDRAVAAFAGLGTGIMVADLEAHLGDYESWDGRTLGILQKAYQQVKGGREFGDAIKAQISAKKQKGEDD